MRTLDPPADISSDPEESPKRGARISELPPNLHNQYYGFVRQVELRQLDALSSSLNELTRSTAEFSKALNTARFTPPQILASNRFSELQKAHPVQSWMQPSPVMKQLMDAGERYRKLFEIPAAKQIQKLLQGPRLGSYEKLLYGYDPREISRKLSALQHPWMHVDRGSASLRAFADLQALGAITRASNPFSVDISSAVRRSLGDWRDPVTLGSRLAEPEPRLQLYADRGFDSALTDFPVEAFDESITAAGLLVPPEPSDSDVGASHDEMVRAFGILRNFEERLRAAVVRIMEAKFGKHWVKQRLPGAMRDAWQAKRQKAIAAEERSLALIHYADFSDYKTIIERNDNWTEAFALYFRRKEDIRESLQRLGPLRIALMHSRPMTSDDLLLLTFETRRILKRIEHQPADGAADSTSD